MPRLSKGLSDEQETTAAMLYFCKVEFFKIAKPKVFDDFLKDPSKIHNKIKPVLDLIDKAFDDPTVKKEWVKALNAFQKETKEVKQKINDLIVSPTGLNRKILIDISDTEFEKIDKKAEVKGARTETKKQDRADFKAFRESGRGKVREAAVAEKARKVAEREKEREKKARDAAEEKARGEAAERDRAREEAAKQKAQEQAREAQRVHDAAAERERIKKEQIAREKAYRDRMDRFRK